NIAPEIVISALVFQSLTRASHHSDPVFARLCAVSTRVPIPHSGKRSFRLLMCDMPKEVLFSSNPSLGQAIIPTKASSVVQDQFPVVPIPHSGKRSFRHLSLWQERRTMPVPIPHSGKRSFRHGAAHPAVGDSGRVPIPHSGKRSFRRP